MNKPENAQDLNYVLALSLQEQSLYGNPSVCENCVNSGFVENWVNGVVFGEKGFENWDIEMIGNLAFLIKNGVMTGVRREMLQEQLSLYKKWISSKNTKRWNCLIQ